MKATHKSSEVPKGLREGKEEGTKAEPRTVQGVWVREPEKNQQRRQTRSSQGGGGRTREGGIPGAEGRRVSEGSEQLCRILLGQVSPKVDHWVYQCIGDG